MTPQETAQIITQAIKDGLRPDPDLTVSQWADEYRYLPSKSSSEPGRWRTIRTPYLAEIMDCLSPSHPCEKVVFMKGSQIGGTECGLNWLGYIIHLSPAPILIVEPTVELGTRLSKQRIQPMLDESPIFRGIVKEAGSRESSNTISSKDFKGGVMVITGSNSAVGLRSMPVRFLFMDEADAYVSDVEGEGDPCSLAEKRTTTFNRRKIFVVSTPSIKDFSRIEREFLASDQRHFHVPCPYCNEYQWLKWSGIVWDHSAPHKPIYESVGYKCRSCGRKIAEHHKTWMLEHGKWVADNPSSKIPGFFLNSLYSPLGWKSWKAILEEFYESKNVMEKLKTFTNTILGETWEESAEKVESNPLYDRREKYDKIPLGAYVLTCGCDVQKNRIEAEVVAWGLNNESWSIDYKVFDGDPEQTEIWTELDAYLNGVWEHESGAKLKIICTAVDSGDKTSQVYAFVKPRQPNWIRAIKGTSGVGKALLSKRDVRGVLLYSLAVDQFKDSFYARLRIKEPGASYCHFPIHPQYDENHFKQLTAEKVTTRHIKGFPVREWIKVYERNEALDCRVYATAAYQMRGINMESVKANFEKQNDPKKPKPEVTVKVEKPVVDVTYDFTPNGLIHCKFLRAIIYKGKHTPSGTEMSLSLSDAKALLADNVIEDLKLPVTEIPADTFKVPSTKVLRKQMMGS